jgi:hypothetical protein
VRFFKFILFFRRIIPDTDLLSYIFSFLTIPLDWRRISKIVYVIISRILSKRLISFKSHYTLVDNVKYAGSVPNFIKICTRVDFYEDCCSRLSYFIDQFSEGLLKEIILDLSEEGYMNNFLQHFLLIFTRQNL